MGRRAGRAHASARSGLPVSPEPIRALDPTGQGPISLPWAPDPRQGGEGCGRAIPGGRILHNVAESLLRNTLHNSWYLKTRIALNWASHPSSQKAWERPDSSFQLPPRRCDSPSLWKHGEDSDVTENRRRVQPRYSCPGPTVYLHKKLPD